MRAIYLLSEAEANFLATRDARLSALPSDKGNEWARLFSKMISELKALQVGARKEATRILQERYQYRKTENHAGKVRRGHGPHDVDEARQYDDDSISEISSIQMKLWSQETVLLFTELCSQELNYSIKPWKAKLKEYASSSRLHPKLLVLKTHLSKYQNLNLPWDFGMFSLPRRIVKLWKSSTKKWQCIHRPPIQPGYRRIEWTCVSLPHQCYLST